VEDHFTFIDALASQVIFTHGCAEPSFPSRKSETKYAWMYKVSPHFDFSYLLGA